MSGARRHAMLRHDILPERPLPNTLTTELSDRILTITLNRPDQLNAFTVEMANELVAAYAAASLDDEVGAIVLTGSGRAFCAGMDLSTQGNVFGLDEALSPTLADMHDRLEDPRRSRPCATPAAA